MMTAKKCFTAKIAAGKVSPRAGQAILDTLEQFEQAHKKHLGDADAARQAAIDAAEASEEIAARTADLARRSVIAQAGVLRAFHAYDQVLGGLRAEGKAPLTMRRETASPLLAAVRSLLARDPHEIATWANVDKLAQDIRGRAHASFAEAIETLRPKTLGFKAETALELDTLRALYGRTDVEPGARAAAEAWTRTNEELRLQFVEAGGALPERKNWRLPNPPLEAAKVRAAGFDRFAEFAHARVDRAAMLDFDTGKPLTDARFDQLLKEAYETIIAEGVEGAPSTALEGRRMLANARAFPRYFVWKSAEAWQEVAETFGSHASPYQAMIGEIEGRALDIAFLRVLGPNPEATRRFIHSLFDRETARLQHTAPPVRAAEGASADAIKAADDKAMKAVARDNQKIAAQVARDKKRFDELYAEVRGENDIPVNTELARVMSDSRSAMVAAQMGAAIISSITDTATAFMTARFNGIPAMNVIARATAMMGEKGAEIFAAQQGLVADTIASAVGRLDKAFGETIRTGTVAKVGAGVIRGSGLRRWTAILRGAFGLETMAHAARERAKVYPELAPDFKSALARHGIGAEDWDAIRATAPHEPRPNAIFIRPMDVGAAASRTGLDDAAARAAGEKFARLINTEMDYAVIEKDAIARALLIGDSRPGTFAGELRRGVAMYKSFPTAFVTLHFARAFARGFDGKRLTHGALTFTAMTALGALAMQAKQIVAGRQPYSLDPTNLNGRRAWGAAILQGGGLGVFGDMLFIDQTRYGNTWISVAAGPQIAAVEAVLGDFIWKNLQKLGRGEPTQFAGDALYVAGRYLPGSNLWYARLAFQRAVLDQAALMIDPRARERFARLEKTARDNWGQDYWWRPGRLEPARAPIAFAAGG